MKRTRTIEIEDSLPERVEQAIEAVKQELLNYLEENPKAYNQRNPPCLSNTLDYSGTIHEIIDSAVPIYTREINDTWYLYGSKLEEAYENAGLGDNPRENDGMSAIYCYISDKVHDWYNNNASDIFNEWKEKQDEKETD